MSKKRIKFGKVCCEPDENPNLVYDFSCFAALPRGCWQQKEVVIHTYQCSPLTTACKFLLRKFTIDALWAIQIWRQQQRQFVYPLKIRPIFFGVIFFRKFSWAYTHFVFFWWIFFRFLFQWLELVIYLCSIIFFARGALWSQKPLIQYGIIFATVCLRVEHHKVPTQRDWSACAVQFLMTPYGRQPTWFLVLMKGMG